MFNLFKKKEGSEQIQEYLEKARPFFEKEMNEGVAGVRLDANEAIKYFKKVLELDPQNVEALYCRTLISFNRYLLENDDFFKKASLDRVEELLNAYPEEPDFWELKAKICDKVFKYEMAAECRKVANKLKNEKRTNDTDKFDEEVRNNCKIRTHGGLSVQSQGEKLIAEFLERNSIDFDYDKQISLKGNHPNQNKNSISWIRPDFYLTEFNIIIEYWGLKGTPDYDKQMDEKKRLYKESGQKLISISPEDLDDLEELLQIKLKRMGVNLE